jgi:hypothetical protein
MFLFRVVLKSRVVSVRPAGSLLPARFPTRRAL